MRPFLFILAALLAGLTACHNQPSTLADPHFTDSLITHGQPAAQEKLLSQELIFWKNRLDSQPGAFTALARYAGLRGQHFHNSGEMSDLAVADSIYRCLNREYKGNEAGILRAWASLNITRHRFREADSLVQLAMQAGSEQYATTLLSFDTKFELGSYLLAERALQSCIATNEYGYFFRLAKWKHFQGETDSALYYMQKAADWSGNSLFLRQTALSNLADLYMHEGGFTKAARLYTGILKQNPADYHSLRGLGRIQLLHDKHPASAEKVFRYISVQNALPDPLYDMVWVAEQEGDSALQQTYATVFVQKAGDSAYGAMYHKYLLELYTGILHKPVLAISIAEEETRNRPTPQAFAWLAWSLHMGGDDARAMKVYLDHVSGKPLEALELYWMGKLMQAVGKQYIAHAFFTAAAKNRYDLSPLKQKDLAQYL